MSNLHKEINFENDLCNHLSANGWLYAEGAAASYSRGHALFPEDVIAWVQATQPKAWETLTKNQGAAAETTLLDRIRKQLDDRGTLACTAPRRGTAGVAPVAATGSIQTSPGHES